MRNRTKFTMLLTALFLGLGSLTAATINVSNGDNLQAAIDGASGGDEIIIEPGTYASISISSRNFTETESLIIRGDGTGEVIIDESNTGTNAVYITSSSYIVLANIILQNGKNGFEIILSDHIVIRETEVMNSAAFGMWIGKGSHYIDVIDNKIHDTANIGLSAADHWSFPDSCSYFWIEGNEIYNCGTSSGLFVKDDLFHYTLKDNLVHDIDATNAIYIKEPIKSKAFSWNLTTTRDGWVDGNVVYNTDTNGINGYGILAGGSGVNIINNTAYDNTKRGISCSSYDDIGLPVRVYNNTAYDNGDGNSWNQVFIHGDLIDATSDVDPGTNPNTAQNWYYFNVTGVTLDQSSVTLTSDDTISLAATITPYYPTDKSVTWSSSDDNVATVNTNGLVTGVSVGSAIITVTTNDGTYTANCDVIITIPTGIFKDPSFKKLSFYPNPLHSKTSNALTFELSDSESEIIISDTNGKVVYKTITQSKKITINNISLKEGLYIISVQTGIDIKTDKLIVY